MSLSYNCYTVGGTILGEIQQGYEPQAWLLVTIRMGSVVWDRYGNRVPVPTQERIVIQGKENVKEFKRRLYEGLEVLASGQYLPAKYVIGDAEIRGKVLSASTFQIGGHKE